MHPDRSFTIGIALDDPRVYRDELQISLARLEGGQRELQAVQPSLRELESQAPDPFKVQASYLLGVQQAIDIQSVLRGIRNVLRLLEGRIGDGGRNDRLLKAEAEFRRAFPEAWNLRDILEHLPDYVAGEGTLQKKGEMPTDCNFPNLVYSSARDASSEITLLFNFEMQKIEVKAAARKAIEIAGLLAKADAA